MEVNKATPHNLEALGNTRESQLARAKERQDERTGSGIGGVS